MDIFPFFRLLRSPVYLWIALGISPLLIFVPTWNVSSDSFVDLIYMFWLVAFLGFWGYAIGNLVGENQHRMFTWSLPGFRKRLMVWTASIGLLSVSAWTALLMSASWNVAWPVVFCVNLGIYSLGFAIAGGWGVIAHRFGFGAMSRFILVALGLAVAWQWRGLIAFVQEQPLALAVIVFAIAVGAFYLAFNQKAFRMKPFALFFSMHAAYYSPTQEWLKKNILKTRNPSTKIWHLDHIGTGIVNWLRASQYENYGYHAHSWLFSAFYAALMLPFWFIFTTFGLNVFQYDFDAVLRTLYQAAFHFDQLESKTAIMISGAVFVALLLYFYSPFSAFSLKKGYVYPLSRNRQMWIRYCGLLVQSVSFFLSSALLLGVLGVLAGAKIGFASDVFLGVLCPLGWGLVLAPLFQWVQVKYLLHDNQYWIFLFALLFFACIVGIGMCAMRLLYPDLILTVEVPLLITCFALLQWFLLSRLKRHYTTADLV